MALTGDVFTTKTTISSVFDPVREDEDTARRRPTCKTPSAGESRRRRPGGRCWTFEKGDFVVRGGGDDVELTDVEVQSFEPDVLPGGKAVIGGLIKTLIKTNKAEISKLVAEKLEPVQLSSCPGGGRRAGPQRRQPGAAPYAQSVILSELIRHDSPKTGLTLEEKGDGVVVSGTGRLENPRKLTEVRVVRRSPCTTASFTSAAQCAGRSPASAASTWGR